MGVVGVPAVPAESGIPFANAVPLLRHPNRGTDRLRPVDMSGRRLHCCRVGPCTGHTIRSTVQRAG